MKKYSKGFTLIELLVVIAIVGLLSAVVLASLNAARNTGADAGIKSNLSTIRREAEIFYSTNSDSYGTWNGGAKATCPSSVAGAGNMMNDSIVVKAIAAALQSGGNGTSCIVTGGAYAISVGMKTANQAWCIDSVGTSKMKIGVATPDLAITGSACN
jgi:prepilin-type N-terminal cleavage/methylation domain-containing protein